MNYSQDPLNSTFMATLLAKQKILKSRLLTREMISRSSLVDIEHDHDSEVDDCSEPAEGMTNTKPKLEQLDPKLVGMSVGYKNLYSGKEDKRGRFQWQETVPEDLIPPAENAETQKWAIIARYVKVYGDPRRTLALNSIVIQSPLLKKVLEEVLAGYPNVTVGLQRLEFSDKFECLIHRFPELNAVIDKIKAKVEEEASQITSSDASNNMQPNGIDEAHGAEPQSGEKTTQDTVPDQDTSPEPSLGEAELTLKHTELLRDLLMTEFQSLIESSRDMKANNVITFEALWTLFQPGHLVFAREEGQDRVFKLISGKEGLDEHNNRVFWLSTRFIDFDGIKFGWRNAKVKIPIFQGTSAIPSLAAYPLEHHPEEDAIRTKLIARSSAIEALTGTHYRAYDGIGWRLDMYGQKERHSVKGRIVVDTVGWNRYQPNSAIFVSALNGKGNDKVSTRQIYLPPLDENDDPCDADFGGMPIDGHFNEDEDPKKAPSLTDEQKLLCTHLLRGYALKEKMWLNLFVNSVHDIEFNDSAFESLVLPENTKELILGFTCTQQAFRISYDDVIEGKGRGIILLLCGPPGVGKTLTAESVAEEMKVPLFVMSAGDLGMDSKMIEARLLSVLGMCTRWNAILLLDEADIFLEERSLHEVERNKLVSIFLRVLEYHEGIMFLTTNRVSTFDPAFQSRIHISIDYPELSPESRRTIWENFLRRHNEAQAAARLSPPKNPLSSIKSEFESKDEADEQATKAKHDAMTQPHAITKQEIRQLSLLKLNGRQIKNMLKTAQLLANRKAEPLSHGHVKIVIDATQHLHNASKATEHARSSIFN